MTRKTRRKILKFVSAVALIVFVFCGCAISEALSIPSEALSMENPYFVLCLLSGGWLTLIFWLTN